MIKRINKYFIILVSALLVLSNFSFATQQMLCSMNMDNMQCSCQVGENNDNPGGINYKNDRQSCCEKNILELNNTNNLQTNGSELPKNINNLTPEIFNFHSIYSLNSAQLYAYIPVTEHVPRADIPILISSLLI